MSAELCPGEPLLRVGGEHQQTAGCKASQEPDQSQSEKYPQEGMGLNPRTPARVDCQPSKQVTPFGLFLLHKYNLLLLYDIWCFGNVSQTV